MERTFIALVITVAAFNAAAAMDTNQAANNAESNAANAAFNETTSRDGTGRFNADGSFSQDTINHAIDATARARQSDAEAARYAGATYNNHYGQSYLDAKNNQSALAASPAVNAASYRLGIEQQQQKSMGVASINVAVSSLQPKTPISVTVNGITKIVAASTLAPTTQVAVPHIPAFERNPGKGTINDQGSSHSVSGSGNGANNAANTHSAHGLGGGDHIGGGSAMGGGFHGNW